MWQPATRYPDPAVVVLDPRFAKYRVSSAAVERIATGMRWAEGPVWFGDGRYLLWSDVPNDRIMRWDEATGAVSVFRQPSGNANGHTRDRQGRLVGCEHLGRRIVRTEYDGSTTTLVDRFEGARLNSPNDIVVKSDGSIWFTDPPFGILGWYEGVPAQPERPECVYRFDPATGQTTVVTDAVARPNGLCFSPDEKLLYVVESGAAPKRIRVFDVAADGTALTNDRVFHTCGENESPDGFRCDVDGNLWAGWGTGEGNDGVRIFAPDGTTIGRIHLPERCANLCFGGRHRNRLFMAASQSVYSLYVNTQGAVGG
ncbi:SMP-30/gluconolactonase/LRE family protein [Pseudorhodoferax sp. Leaf274]|uniref:SMP-30/gluconolactonase/LRE family protein n=1 Tax=Pseudorhodoferax sp. Leaf274 TaxID=1736318 RepID=UPI0007035906|nr:SMP-30/gluconolactonase/LRE family protein [Pseudorhodoferax sp. Leaf274]KQP41585.1 gluconolactonase [Pseudorhodoferax sp. Leaf274]